MTHPPTITIFGASGFLGRYVVRRLAKSKALIRAVMRHPDQATFLKSMGEVGQITPVQAYIQNKDEVLKAVMGSDIVINLVGILHQHYSQTFQALHHQGAKNIAEACAHASVSQFIHVSAIGAHSQSDSFYARTKGLGEQAIHSIFPTATIIRPSVIFGPEDKFINFFASMACMSPFLPLIGGGHTRLQPVYVDDVAAAIEKIANVSPLSLQSFTDTLSSSNGDFGHLSSILAELKKTKPDSSSTDISLPEPSSSSRALSSAGTLYELGGPTIYTFKELLTIVLSMIGRQRILLPIPFNIATIIGAILEIFPNPPLTADQVRLLKYDNVVSDTTAGFKELGIKPHALEVMTPHYLSRFVSPRVAPCQT